MYPVLIVEVKKEDNGPPVGPPVNIEIIGEDFEMLGEISRKY
jgi:multidrug efflux pump